MDNYAAHQKLVDDILLAVGSTPHCRVWRNATGTAKTMRGNRIISFGLKGSPDIVGILANGRWLGIEAKTGKGKQNDDQINFQRMVVKFNGLYILARSVEDAVIGITEALK